LDRQDVISPLTIHEGEGDHEWWPAIGDVDSEDDLDEPPIAHGELMSMEGDTFHGLFAAPLDDVQAETVSVAGSNRSIESIENWIFG
jgi:hypothetical protein